MEGTEKVYHFINNTEEDLKSFARADTHIYTFSCMDRAVTEGGSKKWEPTCVLLFLMQITLLLLLIKSLNQFLPQ
jgi:hypothetical protein